MKFVFTLFFLFQPTTAAQSPMPNPAFTPGFTRNMTLIAICNTKWGKDQRHVTIKMKKQVFAFYGIDWSTRKLYEVDHLIPREIGGADDVRNLWPEPWDDAHKKDKEENHLHKVVCDGSMKLDVAQAQMRNWNAVK
jgi:hypothetical protein